MPYNAPHLQAPLMSSSFLEPHSHLLPSAYPTFHRGASSKKQAQHLLFLAHPFMPSVVEGCPQPRAVFPILSNIHQDKDPPL